MQEDEETGEVAFVSRLIFNLSPNPFRGALHRAINTIHTNVSKHEPCCLSQPYPLTKVRVNATKSSRFQPRQLVMTLHSPQVPLK